MLIYANICFHESSKRKQRGKVSLTIQYKTITRVDVTSIVVMHPSAFHERGDGESVRDERDG